MKEWSMKMEQLAEIAILTSLIRERERTAFIKNWKALTCSPPKKKMDKNE